MLARHGACTLAGLCGRALQRFHCLEACISF